MRSLPWRWRLAATEQPSPTPLRDDLPARTHAPGMQRRVDRSPLPGSRPCRSPQAPSSPGVPPDPVLDHLRARAGSCEPCGCSSLRRSSRWMQQLSSSIAQAPSTRACSAGSHAGEWWVDDASLPVLWAAIGVWRLCWLVGLGLQINEARALPRESSLASKSGVEDDSLWA